MIAKNIFCLGNSLSMESQTKLIRIRTIAIPTVILGGTSLTCAGIVQILVKFPTGSSAVGPIKSIGAVAISAFLGIFR